MGCMGCMALLFSPLLATSYNSRNSCAAPDTFIYGCMGENRAAKRHKGSAFIGVTKSNKKFKVQINNKKGVQQYLGSFETEEEALKILRHGLYFRKMHETVKNTESSRSHAVFQIRLYQRQSQEML